MPSVASARLEPGIGCTLPSLYLPIRGPRMIAPVSAAQPPTECTMVDPAKSEKPAALRKPPPQLQLACSGYMIAVRRMVKVRKGHSLIRSASAPETIEAVAAQNINWKKKSDPVEA